MRMRHFKDQYGHFFLEEFFLGKKVFALCIAVLYHKNMKKIVLSRYKKKLNIYGIPSEKSLTLSFQEFISAKINLPQKLISNIKNLFNLRLTELQI